MTEKETRLAELKRSISEMSDEELATLLDHTRNNRRAPPKKVKMKVSKKKEPTGKIVTKIAASLTPEQSKALLAKLLASNDGSDSD